MDIIIPVLVIVILCFLRVHPALSITCAALIVGFNAKMDIIIIGTHYTKGITEATTMALSYAFIGGFASILSFLGITNGVARFVCHISAKRGSRSKWLLLSGVLIMSFVSQNIIPVHIAFIPMVVPPLLLAFNRMQIDRRLVACMITFGLVCGYTIVPIGFGDIYINQILLKNLSLNGIHTNTGEIILAMIFPALGMALGLCLATFFSYAKPRHYEHKEIMQTLTKNMPFCSRHSLNMALFALLLTIFVQLFTSSMVFGALSGCLLLYLGHPKKRAEIESAFVEGLKIMAPFGFIMMASSGLAEVLQSSNTITPAINSIIQAVPHKELLILLMLFLGMVITMGIGSSFSTIPILATLYIPITQQMGLSPIAVIALIGTAGILGDAGSSAADSTLGATSGLNVDNQHHHLRGTVIPTFLHYSLPLLGFGWLAVVLLS